jgi:Tol biopolymer transport system component
MGSRGQTREIWYLDVVTGKITFFYASPDYFDACWSPTTDHFIAAFDTGFTLMTPQGVPPLDLSFVDPSVWLLRPGSTTPCDWSPDGTKLLLIYGRNYPLSPGVKVIDFTARTVSDIYVGNRYSLLHPYWSADSRMLALKTYHLSRDPNDVYIYDMATLQPVLFQKELEFINWVSLPSQ